MLENKSFATQDILQQQESYVIAEVTGRRTVQSCNESQDAQEENVKSTGCRKGMNGNTMAGKEREKCYWIIVINSGVDKAPADPTAQ